MKSIETSGCFWKRTGTGKSIRWETRKMNGLIPNACYKILIWIPSEDPVFFCARRRFASSRVFDSAPIYDNLKLGMKMIFEKRARVETWALFSFVL